MEGDSCYFVLLNHSRVKINVDKAMVLLGTVDYS